LFRCSKALRWAMFSPSWTNVAPYVIDLNAAPFNNDGIHPNAAATRARFQQIGIRVLMAN
jgi:hypothetical protein